MGAEVYYEVTVRNAQPRETFRIKAVTEQEAAQLVVKHLAEEGRPVEVVSVEREE